jgi:oligopeptide/dipeptide ABC transporter ATP-binding protein
MQAPLLAVENLSTRFHTRDGIVHAVNGVSFQLDAGETLALVGESGSGKSVAALSILRLVREPPGEVRGAILFRGEDLGAKSEGAMQAIRGNAVAMVFQEPMTALHPVMSCGSQIVEAIRLHRRESRAAAREQASALLARVGIPAPEESCDRYPHEFSGGMRQRVMIAMALAANPALLIADEPTTALDVTVQAQILALLARLRAELGMAVLLITHDLGVAAEVADRVAVVYAGQIVEEGRTADLFMRPLHPYTQGLLASMPRLGGGAARLVAIPGAVPDPLAPVRGCAFHPRCPLADARCRAEAPLAARPAPGRRVACFRAGEMAFAPVSARASREVS